MTQTSKLIAGLFFLPPSKIRRRNIYPLTGPPAGPLCYYLTKMLVCITSGTKTNLLNGTLTMGSPCQIARSCLLDGDIYPCLPFYVTLLPPLLQTDISCNLHIYKRSLSGKHKYRPFQPFEQRLDPVFFFFFFLFLVRSFSGTKCSARTEHAVYSNYQRVRYC